MFPDFLTKKAMSRAVSDSLTYQMKRGRLSSLLFLNTMTWHWKDMITIKLRHAEGQTTIVDRVSALLLLQLCDLKQGKTTTGTINFIDNDTPSGIVNGDAGGKFNDNAFLLPLGHLTLENAELEVIVELAQQAAQAPATQPQTGVVTICSVETSTASDHIYTYDINNDLETTAHQVREIYLVKKDNSTFFQVDQDNQTTIGQDVVCRLDFDGNMKEVSVDVLGALTNILGEMSYPANGLLKAFADMGTVGVTVGVKVFGSDCEQTSLLYIREIIIPTMVAQSIHSAINLEQRKVEKLEQRAPEQAAALRAAGKISSSETLAEAKAALPPVQVPTA
jgi:hypothetical protein